MLETNLSVGKFPQPCHPLRIPSKKRAPLFTKHLFSNSEKLFLWLTAENSKQVYAEESEGHRVYLGLSYLKGPEKGQVGY